MIGVRRVALRPSYPSGEDGCPGRSKPESCSPGQRVKSNQRMLQLPEVDVLLIV